MSMAGEPMASPDYADARQTDFDQIPIIDMKGKAFGALAAEVVHVAETSGFFYVTGHGISPELRARAFAASRRFFALPEAAKATVTVDRFQRGWMAEGFTRLEGSKTHDAKEVFFWGYETAEDDPDYLEGLPMVAPNRWPVEAAPWLFDEIQPYYQAVIALSKTLMAAIAEGLGQDRDLFSVFYEKPLARGQLVYYPALEAHDLESERMGAAAHTDFGALTILAQDDLGGLQVRNRAGEWIEAPPVPDSFVCNIGDLLQLWTGGRLRSTLHRVINRATVPRYSIPIFCDPASETPIDPEVFGADRSGPVITAGEHIAGRNSRNFTHTAGGAK